MIHQLDWLHVSDFHFSTRDDFSQRVATRALVEDVERRIAGQHPLAFVLVTGDVAETGKPEEYDLAGRFLSDLAATVGLSSASFYFVPGNHDVDRSRQRLAYVGACQELRSESEVDRLLGSPDDLAPLLERQAAFREFVESFTGGQERVPTNDGLGYVAPLVLDGLTICIIGLNSAWLSGKPDEEMRLVLGERQIINALLVAEEHNPQLRIVLAHHPVGWLQEWDQPAVQQRLLPEVDFYSRGHLHLPEVSLASSPDRPCLSIAAGSAHATRFYANSYNFVSVDLGLGTCAVHPYRYDPIAGHYEKASVVSAPVQLRGSLPGTKDDLVEALASAVPGVAAYATYLSALLVGHKEEVPARVGSAVDFLRPSVAEAIAGDGLAPVFSFLKLRNLLRLYDEAVPLAQRVAEYAAVIADFGAYLGALASEDPECARRLVGGSVEPRLSTDSSTSRLPRSADFLAELRATGNWPLLEAQAARFRASTDALLALMAKRFLVEALIHSDQAEKRREASCLAEELVADASALPADYLLAAASSEILGDGASATTWTTRALDLWPGDPDVEQHARALALRSGDGELKAALGRAKRGEPAP